jgi:hypothetical protein
MTDFEGWGRRVLYERAQLAIADPAGEAQAASPMTQQQAWAAVVRFSNAVTWDDDALIAGLHINPFAASGRMTCPAHDDERPSLSWRLAGDGRLLLHCFAGCTFEDIRRAVLG